MLNIDNPCFEGMVSLIYPAELQLNKANSFICNYSLLAEFFSVFSGTANAYTR